MSTTAQPPRRSPEEQTRLDTELALLLEQRISFNQVLGLKVRQLRPQLQLGFAMRPDLVGHFHHGRLHGGVIAAVLDTLGGGALMVEMGEKHPWESCDQVMHRFMRIGTIDLRVDYLRPGLASAFSATCEVIRLGGRVGSTQSRLHDEHGTLIATASAAYVVS